MTVRVHINRFLAEQLRHILVSRLLVTAKVKEFIAVTDDGLPLLFKQSLKLCQVLNDDGHRDLSGTHGGQQLIKLIRERDVRKLVHDKVYVNGKASAVNHVRLVIQLLKQLRVEHADNEIEGTVVVGDNGEDSSFPFADHRKFHFIGLRDSRKGFQVEFLQA